MKVPNTLLALGLMAAVSPFAQLSLAQTAAVKPATPIAASAPTAVPALVPYSGAVISPDGKSFAAESGVTFQIYKDEVGGEALWTETQTVAIDPTGHYKVQLGAANPNGLPTDLFASGEARWLEVQVAGEPAQPRVLLVSVPYALKAADATTLGGLPASAFALARPASEAVAAVSPAITPNVVSNVTTTGGTAGYLPEFSGAATIVDSPLFANGANVGVGTITPATTLDVDGTVTATGLTVNGGNTSFYGPFLLQPQGTATASTGYYSQNFKFTTSVYNSSTQAAVQPRFQLQAVPQGNNTAAPSAILALYSSTTSASPSRTGFSFNIDGTINFSPGQTFPGADITGVVNAAGYDLGGSSFATGSALPGNAYLGFAGNTGSTGGLDTGVGSGALSSNTTGNSNTASGVQALNYNTTGSDNTASGVDALGENTIGSRNTASGSEALYGNTTGSYNTASGISALLTNSTGSSNTAIGADALASNDTGSYNTAVGSQAGSYFNATTSAAPSNTTAIGYGATVSQGNSLVLGQTTGGSPGTSYVNVGIGTDTPRSTLEAVVLATGALGPVLTLTNSGGTTGASVAIDFNTYPPYTTGTYNPAARISAVDVGNYSDNVVFQANKVGSPNNGLLDTVVILPNGDVQVFGTLSAALKDFKIDHPLDPANKYLVHSSVESSEMMNIYTGNVVTDELGLATVKLPGWFQAENADFRYQLTVIGRKAQAWIAEEVGNGQFKIASDATNTKVSWQITAVRQDAYAQAHPLVVEQEKPERERGFTHDKPRLTLDQPASAVNKRFAPSPAPALNHPLLHPAASAAPATKPVAQVKQP